MPSSAKKSKCAEVPPPSARCHRHAFDRAGGDSQRGRRWSATGVLRRPALARVPAWGFVLALAASPLSAQEAPQESDRLADADAEAPAEARPEGDGPGGAPQDSPDDVLDPIPDPPTYRLESAWASPDEGSGPSPAEQEGPSAESEPSAPAEPDGVDGPAEARVPPWYGTWSLYGASLAQVREEDGGSIAIGIELSDVRIRSHQLWWGYYADLRYSQRADGVDLSVGMEAGASVLGVDAGLYARVGRESAIGVRARGCLSALVVVSICAGGGVTNRGAFFEGTILLKYGRRRARPEPVEPSPSEPEPNAEAGNEHEPVAVGAPFERVLIAAGDFHEGVGSAEADGHAEGRADVQTQARARFAREGAAQVLGAAPNARPHIVDAAEVRGVDER
ncbi:MAG: hypothetical protein AAF645_14130 [Myxococcota bacterium]